MCATYRSGLKLLRSCASKSSAWVEGHGYSWFRRSFLVALTEHVRTAHTESDLLLASECFYMLGDAHSFHEAPKAAIRAYRRAYRLDPTWVAAMADAADCLSNIGKHREAERLYRRALKLEPENLYLQNMVEHMVSVVRGNAQDPPLYQEDDVVWRASESLARGQAGRALKILRGERTIRARRHRAMAYGALANVPAAYREWEGIVKSRGAVELTAADWFWLPNELWHWPAFWRLLQSIVNRLNESGLVSMSLKDTVHDANKLGRNGEATRQRNQREFALMLRYHVARTETNIRALRRLTDEYPTWKQPVDLLAFYDRRGRMPRQLTPHQKGLYLPNS